MKQLVTYILLLVGFGLQAQTIDFAAHVSFEYSGETLEDVLIDLSERYEVKFSYSRQMIPMHQEMELRGFVCVAAFAAI